MDWSLRCGSGSVSHHGIRDIHLGQPDHAQLGGQDGQLPPSSGGGGPERQTALGRGALLCSPNPQSSAPAQDTLRRESPMRTFVQRCWKTRAWSLLSWTWKGSSLSANQPASRSSPLLHNSSPPDLTSFKPFIKTVAKFPLRLEICPKGGGGGMLRKMMLD